MRTDDLIVQLAGSAGPVVPLARPMHRLLSWAAAGVAVIVVGVTLIGLRPDAGVMVRQTYFLAMAALTMTTALISAGAALVLSVPGAERSPVQRWAPLLAGGAWAALLLASLVSGGAAVGRILAFPVHAGCIAQIVSLALLPGWALFAMLRRAAPLRRRWSGGLAALAALALAAAGTQFLCPINDSAHLLVGHLVPVAALAFGGALIGARALAIDRGAGRITAAADR